MPSFNRRTFARSSAAILAVAAVGPSVAAARATAAIEVDDTAVAAIVAAIAGTPVTIAARPSGDIGHVTVDGVAHAALGKIVLKGRGLARRRFLDDPRNAPSFGAAVRDVLSKLDPAGAAGYAERHKAWVRPFARQVIQWSGRLAKSSVAGKRVSDPYSRIYLLEWAGAQVSPAAPQAPPVTLASVAAAPSKGTLAAYRAYIQSLVAALV